MQLVGVAQTRTLSWAFSSRLQPDQNGFTADPVGSVMAQYSRDGSLPTPVMGLRSDSGDFIPSITDLSSVRATPIRSAMKKATMPVSCCVPRAFSVESSTGTLLAAALRYCREQTEPKRVVSFVCDTARAICQFVTTSG